MKDGFVSEEKNKPALDEQMLAKLLEAAYVLQEHNRELRELELGLELKRDRIEAEDRSAKSEISVQSSATKSTPDYTSTLAQIVETQHRIQVRHLELGNALTLVAERVVEIGRAYGAAIGIIDGNNVRYRGVAGKGTLPAGTEIPLDKALCIPCIRTGQVFRCRDVDPEVLLDTEDCHRRGIQSLIAVPVFHDGGVAGNLELYYSEQNAFTDQDVHTCQLMAGLVTEALARDEEISWKKSLASERAVMLEALEKLKPNLTAIADKAAPKNALVEAESSQADHAYVCRKCGHKLVGEEQFCGECGSPRNSEIEPLSAESKVASLWGTGEPAKQDAESQAANGKDSDRMRGDDALADTLEEAMPEIFAAPDLHAANAKDSQAGEAALQTTEADAGVDSPLHSQSVEEGSPAESVALVKPMLAADWSSAQSVRDFFEQMAGGKRSGALARFWNSRRGDIYLAIAVLLVACVVRWGIWSNHSYNAPVAANVPAAAPHKASPESNLSLFDRMLISLGLADAPEQAEDRGNPSTQVWVDLHTALYYCPGADQYGKTPSGKYTSQRDAQLDSFEPAYRKTCN